VRQDYGNLKYEVSLIKRVAILRSEHRSEYIYIYIFMWEVTHFIPGNIPLLSTVCPTRYSTIQE